MCCNMFLSMPSRRHCERHFSAKNILMNRRSFVAAAALAATLYYATAAHATVLINDTWQDGTRSDPAAPDYLENGVDLDLDGDLESAWYRGGAGTDQAFLAPVGPGGPLRLDLTPNLTLQSSITTYFATEASPVTLGVGERLKFTFVFTPTLFPSEGILMSRPEFRFAVVDTPAAARISTDVSPGANTYTGYSTMINVDRPNFGAENGLPYELKERTDPNAVNGLISSSGNWTHLGNGATNGNPSFTTGTEYTFTFEFERTAADELDILSRMTGTGLDGDGVAEVSYLDTTPNGGSFTFDTFAMRLNSGYQTFGIMDISLFRVELIPAAIPGDVNFDGFVNIFDINLVSANWGSPGGPTGDANGDGSVNIFDINLISANWTPAPGATAAVPEPSSLALLGFAIVLGSGYAFRRQFQKSR